MRANGFAGSRLGTCWGVQIGLCLAISVAYTVSVFGLAFFSQETYFWFAVGGDLALSASAGRYFIHDAWSFPLLHSASLGAPEGTVIVFADAIPLFALIAKVVNSALGLTIPYHAAWIATCYGLQGVAAGLAVRAAGVRSFVPVITACLIALALPAFLFRFQHASLNGHFLLLLAFAVYFVIVRRDAAEPASLWPEAGFVGLLLASILVHPYLAAMVAALLAAALVQASLDGSLSLRRACFAGLAAAVSAPTLMALSGHIFNGYVPSGGAGFGGFGLYSMNLASPFVPQISGLFPPLPDNLVHLFPAPDRYGGIVDATRGQYEGYNYLGAGLLGLMVACLVAAPRRVFAASRRHWVLSGFCLGLVIFAASSRAYFLDTRLYDVPLHEDLRLLMEQFRSSGRFFWLVTYALLIGSVVFLGRTLSVRTATILLLGAVALQIADTRPLRVSLREFVHQDGDPGAPFARWIWEPILARHDRVVLRPPVACQYSDIAAMFQILSSYRLVPITSAWTSGRTNRDCAAEEAAAIALPDPSQDALTIFIADHILPDRVAQAPIDASLCRQFPGGTACSHMAAEFWTPETYFVPLDPSRSADPSADPSAE